jgi:hypothetical protein
MRMTSSTDGGDLSSNTTIKTTLLLLHMLPQLRALLPEQQPLPP